MFFSLFALTASASVDLTEGYYSTIYIYSGNVLVPESPYEYSGKAGTSSSVETEVFGNTGIYILNFTSYGYLKVKSYTRTTFTYYLFQTDYCTSIDIIINPYTDHYYRVAAQGYSSYYSKNETMTNNVKRCFWYVLNSSYSVSLDLQSVETYDQLKYKKYTYDSYTRVYSSSYFTADEYLVVVWQTDSSTTQGSASFTLTKYGTNRGYLRPTIDNSLCIGTYNCRWYTMDSVPHSPPSSSSGGMSLGGVVVIVVVSVIFFIVFCGVVCDRIKICGLICNKSSGVSTPPPPPPQTQQSLPTTQQYSQPPPQQYVQPQPYGQPQMQSYGQPQIQPYGQPQIQPYGQPQMQSYGQPPMQPYGQPPQQYDDQKKQYEQPPTQSYENPYEQNPYV